MRPVVTEFLIGAALMVTAASAGSQYAGGRKSSIANPEDLYLHRHPHVSAFAKERSSALPYILSIRGGSTDEDGETIDLDTADSPATQVIHGEPVEVDAAGGITAAVTKIEQPPLSSKLVNLQERLVPALVALAAVGAWAYYLKEDGLILLTIVLQIGMYGECTRVIGGELSSKLNSAWWLLTALVAANGPRMFPWASPTLTAITYGMASLGIVANIMSLNAQKATPEGFRNYLREAAVAHLAILLVVVPSSFWISTLEEYGMIWILYSFALVIINDTMAYVFGMTVGKHALLPGISPKKTWEGFLGAAVSTVAAAMFLLPERRDAVVLSLASSLLGPFGGFLASVIKRAYGEKDFGTLMPGHGGFVDRMDVQVMMAAFTYLYLVFTRPAGASGSGGL